MSRLIDADALGKRIWELRRQYQLMDDTQTADVIMHGIYRVEQGLDDIPTVDAVPVDDLCEKINEAHNEGYDVGYWAGRRDYEKKWIPVAERLPEEGTAVNITWVNHNPVIYYQHIKDKPQTATGVYYHRKWYWWSADVQDYLAEYGEWEPDKMDVAIEVTHWMPLPEPPK